MEVKGTAVKSILDFVKIMHPGEFAKWMRELPEESQTIMSDVRSNNWYSVEKAAIVPTELAAKHFFNNDIQKAAWELGKYSAESALKGIYKIYVKFSAPTHIIARGSRIMSAYYSPSALEVADKKPNSIRIVITEFDTTSDVLEHRIGGWVESALEISGCKDISVKITSSLTKGHSNTTIECSWG